jgi:hypothetical protein
MQQKVGTWDILKCHLKAEKLTTAYSDAQQVPIRDNFLVETMKNYD